MSRIQLPAPESVPEKSKPILEKVGKRLGLTPNLFTLVSISPASLTALDHLQTTLGRTLDAKTRDRIHIMVGEVNGCDYCVSAHTWLGAKLNKLTAEDMELNRQGHSTDPKADVAVNFAHKIAVNRGHVTTADVDAVRTAGYTDADIIDIVTTTAFSFMTNFFNLVADVEIDATFPVIHTHHTAQAGA
ncbi:carboxymuconolactone decarboxylase family protein [Streptomyces sp. NPDC055722]